MAEVCFLMRDAPWNKGDVAQMSDASARKLIRRGVAEAVRAAPQTPSNALQWPETDPDEPEADRGGRG